MQEKYRQAYLKMYEIRKSSLWSPSSEYLHLMEKFWWYCANLFFNHSNESYEATIRHSVEDVVIYSCDLLVCFWSIEGQK